MTNDAGTKTFQFTWLNKGEPFDFGPHRVTPHGARASAAHKSLVLKDRLSDLNTAGLPPLAVQAIVDSVKEEAYLAAGEALLYWSLIGVDPSIEKVGRDDLMKRLSLEQYGDLMEALKRPQKGKKADPLVTLTPTTASS